LFLGKDTLVCETEELLLKTGLGSDNSNIRFTWQDGTTASNYKVKGPGLYFVRASNNCTLKMDTIQVTYKVCPLGIPNAFTPNGDGRNDRFRAKYGSGISKYRLRIFNRFGQLVFESADQLNGWDGSMAGKNQPAGTYAWYVQYTDVVNGKPVVLKGTVTLIR
jgi:gliding motility-associated-like protein